MMRAGHWLTSDTSSGPAPAPARRTEEHWCEARSGGLGSVLSVTGDCPPTTGVQGYYRGYLNQRTYNWWTGILYIIQDIQTVSEIFQGFSRIPKLWKEPYQEGLFCEEARPLSVYGSFGVHVCPEYRVFSVRVPDICSVCLLITN